MIPSPCQISVKLLFEGLNPHHFLLSWVGVGQLLFFHLDLMACPNRMLSATNEMLDSCWSMSEALFGFFFQAAASHPCNISVW